MMDKQELRAARAIVSDATKAANRLNKLRAIAEQCTIDIALCLIDGDEQGATALLRKCVGYQEDYETALAIATGAVAQLETTTSGVKDTLRAIATQQIKQEASR